VPMDRLRSLYPCHRRLRPSPSQTWALVLQIGANVKHYDKKQQKNGPEPVREAPGSRVRVRDKCGTELVYLVVGESQARQLTRCSFPTKLVAQCAPSP